MMPYYFETVGKLRSGGSFDEKVRGRIDAWRWLLRVPDGGSCFLDCLCLRVVRRAKKLENMQVACARRLVGSGDMGVRAPPSSSVLLRRLWIVRLVLVLVGDLGEKRGGEGMVSTVVVGHRCSGREERLGGS